MVSAKNKKCKRAVQPVQPWSREGRIALAKMVMQLFDHWHIGTTDRLALLGLSKNSGASLIRYRNGRPVANRATLVNRIGHLQGIHRSLCTLFLRSGSIVYQWPTRANEAFGGISQRAEIPGSRNTAWV